MTDFKVRKIRGWDPEKRALTDELLGWDVYLPHQCEAWQISISGYDTGRNVILHPDREQATTQLRAFLDDGLAALAALAAGEEYGEEEVN